MNRRTLRKLPEFRPRGGGFGAWLFRIAANELTDHHRREARPRSDRGQRAMSMMQGLDDDIDPLIRDDDCQLIRAAIAQLSPRHQQAINLRYLADLSNEEAANAMTRLVNQDGALFVVGENQSSLSLAMAPAAAKGQVPMISPSSTNPRVTSEGGPYVFRVCFTDTFQGQLLARYARETLKAERVAILVDQKSDYAVGLSKVFATRFGAVPPHPAWSGIDMAIRSSKAPASSAVFPRREWPTAMSRLPSTSGRVSR